MKPRPYAQFQERPTPGEETGAQSERQAIRERLGTLVALEGLAPVDTQHGISAKAGRRYALAMRPLRYAINVTLDGCCDHRAVIPNEASHRHALEGIAQADALLLGRVTYELMEAG